MFTTHPLSYRNLKDQKIQDYLVLCSNPLLNTSIRTSPDTKLPLIKLRLFPEAAPALQVCWAEPVTAAGSIRKTIREALLSMNLSYCLMRASVEVVELLAAASHATCLTIFSLDISCFLIKAPKQHLYLL